MDYEQSCDHSKDVAFRCELPGWTGLRLGVLADTCNLQYVTIEKAGLFDYITNEFGPGMFFGFSFYYRILKKTEVIQYYCFCNIIIYFLEFYLFIL